MSIWKRRLAPWALAIVTMTAFTAHGNFNEQELDCEEVASFVASCCPGFSAAKLSCTNNGCDNHYADLSIAESECILALSCSEIRSRGLCDSLTHLTPNKQNYDSGSMEYHPSVCR